MLVLLGEVGNRKLKHALNLVVRTVQCLLLRRLHELELFSIQLVPPENLGQVINRSLLLQQRLLNQSCIFLEEAAASGQGLRLHK